MQWQTWIQQIVKRGRVRISDREALKFRPPPHGRGHVLVRFCGRGVVLRIIARDQLRRVTYFETTNYAPTTLWKLVDHWTQGLLLPNAKEDIYVSDN